MNLFPTLDASHELVICCQSAYQPNGGRILLPLEDDGELLLEMLMAYIFLNALYFPYHPYILKKMTLT
jgi:hypothetical protein